MITVLRLCDNGKTNPMASEAASTEIAAEAVANLALKTTLSRTNATPTSPRTTTVSHLIQTLNVFSVTGLVTLLPIAALAWTMKDCNPAKLVTIAISKLPLTCPPLCPPWLRRRIFGKRGPAGPPNKASPCFEHVHCPFCSLYRFCWNNKINSKRNLLCNWQQQG